MGASPLSAVATIKRTSAAHRLRQSATPPAPSLHRRRTMLFSHLAARVRRPNIHGMADEDHSYRSGHGATGCPVLILSVAGKAEAQAGRPAAGRARDHLDAILSRLHAARPDLFPHADADAYPILNAHPGVEYRGLTGRTEAPASDYVDVANLARVRARVAGRSVVAFGSRARRTCAAAGIVPLMTGRHPSSLNRVRNIDVYGETPADRTASRYDQAAAVLLQTLNLEAGH